MSIITIRKLKKMETDIDIMLKGRDPNSIDLEFSVKLEITAYSSCVKGYNQKHQESPYQNKYIVPAPVKKLHKVSIESEPLKYSPLKKELSSSAKDSEQKQNYTKLDLLLEVTTSSYQNRNGGHPNSSFAKTTMRSNNIKSNQGAYIALKNKKINLLELFSDLRGIAKKINKAADQNPYQHLPLEKLCSFEKGHYLFKLHSHSILVASKHGTAQEQFSREIWDKDESHTYVCKIIPARADEIAFLRREIRIFEEQNLKNNNISTEQLIVLPISTSFIMSRLMAESNLLTQLADEHLKEHRNDHSILQEASDRRYGVVLHKDSSAVVDITPLPSASSSSTVTHGHSPLYTDPQDKSQEDFDDVVLVEIDEEENDKDDDLGEESWFVM